MLFVLACASVSHAQDAATPAGVEARETLGEPSADATRDALAAANSPKTAVVVVGDADPALQAAALRVERAISHELRLPADPGLRAALRGEVGSPDDGLDEVRRSRRRLGLDEARDAAALATLGRQAGAQAVTVVRSDESGAPSLTVLDVASRRLYEGSLSLTADITDQRIARFVARRARTSQASAAGGGREGGPASSGGADSLGAAATPASTLPEPTLPPATPVPSPALPPTSPDAPPPEPDFFEQFWPYLVAGALLAGMITAVALTSSGTSAADQPVLRFVPGP
jgi:hypothetical protein